MAALLDNLLTHLGYTDSQFYREDIGAEDVSVAHLLRDARRAHVRGTYFLRTTSSVSGNERERPAVHVAEARSPAEAREIHRKLWNQGTTPFLLVSLPTQVRVYTSFAYDEANPAVGQIDHPLDAQTLSLREIAHRLEFLRAESIDSGDIWRLKGDYLRRERRVDQLLLGTLRSLTQELVRRHRLDRQVAHALIGRFVYLYYLRERGILSREWLTESSIDPEAVFTENATLKGFRQLTNRVDERFNGRIFPIDWNSSTAPHSEAVKAVARAFAGEDPGSGQMALFRIFDFSFVPIELLSAIYEHFLHDEGKGDKDGAFYTSEPVADYLIAELDSVKQLRPGMKVLDPCCGSGIFLVLAYRRLIEQELRNCRSSTMQPDELAHILTSSIFGIERNPEACLVTEFSLILTLLDYVEPPELHQHPNFKFPKLHNQQIFECDLFEKNSAFARAERGFEWIIGNPPWQELEQDDADERPAISWITTNQKAQPVARYRSSEAVTWRVRDWAAEDGVIGLLTPATSLTNDHSVPYRKAFFSRNTVHRITNFSNLAYVLFESAEEPAATVVYSVADNENFSGEIIHFGPLVANQWPLVPGRNRRRRVPWVLTISESEIQTVPASIARMGYGTTWKSALWGNPRDRRAIERLRQALPKTLADISKERGWHLNLGVQLRRDRGAELHPNQDVKEIKRAQGCSAGEAERFSKWFADLNVLDPKQLQKAKSRLTLQDDWLVENRWGKYIRENRSVGLNVVRAPHLFLWNEFASFSEEDFIFRHPKIGLAAPPEDSDWLRAVSVIWASSITPYVLFLTLSAGWGISRSTIDLGDVRRMPMPALTETLVNELAAVHGAFSQEEGILEDRTEWQRRLDQKVASILRIPSQVMLLAREFRDFRLPLVKGKAPARLLSSPNRSELELYARRLSSELDGFLKEKTQRHQVNILHSTNGLVVSIELTTGKRLPRTISATTTQEKHLVESILESAEEKFGQWVYVRRSVRVIGDNRMYICKPARRLEWTESQALLDAGDVIAEVVENLNRHA